MEERQSKIWADVQPVNLYCYGKMMKWTAGVDARMASNEMNLTNTNLHEQQQIHEFKIPQ
jgi:hypothetical protein